MRMMKDGERKEEDKKTGVRMEIRKAGTKKTEVPTASPPNQNVIILHIIL